VTGVLVLGGYGSFGSRLCELLATCPELTVHVAGRNLAAATAVAKQFGPATMNAVALDRDAPDGIAAFLRANRPRVVVDAIGPFQGRDYRLPELVAAHGAHALDLADDRSFVTGIGALGARARARDVLIVSGASTVPALSSAVVDRLLNDLDSLESVEIGISPGNRSPRGPSAVRSVLSYCGKPIPAVAPAHRATRRGWGDLVRHRYPAPVGGRWLSNVDVPDIALLPHRYPGIESVEVRAGLELSVLHLGLSMLSALVARGVISSLVPASGFLRRVAGTLRPFGSDAGAMHVSVLGARGQRRYRRHWAIVAEQNDGPLIPVTAASVIAKRLCGAAGYPPLSARGAMPCVGLVDLDEFLMELRGRAIRTVMYDEALSS
jgi:Saccharopine dehydrogenase NADP binding domain